MNIPPLDRMRKPIAMLFLGGAIVSVLTVIAVAWNGGQWQFSMLGIRVSAGHPKRYLVLGTGALLMTHLFWVGFKRSPREWLALVGRLVLLGVSLALSIVVAEQGLRISLRQGESSGNMQDLADFEQDEASVEVQAAHPLASVTRVSANKKLVYELRPNLDTKFGHRELRSNRTGLRADRDYTIEKPAGTVRIIGLGDSGMWGWAVHQHEVYMALLEVSLKEREEKQYEVLNFAMPGYNTFQEIEMLRYKGLQYKPDIVVINWCRNDYQPPFFATKKRTYDERDVSYVWLLLFDRPGFKRRTEPIVLKAGEVDAKFVDPVILEHSGWTGVKKCLQQLKTLGAEHGFKVLVYGPMNDEAAAIVADIGLENYNTYELRQEDYPDVNIHGMHPRPEANRIHAEYIEKALDQRGWL